MKRPVNRALISIQRRRCYRIAAASTQPTPSSSAHPAPSTAHGPGTLTPPASRPDRAATQALQLGNPAASVTSATAQRPDTAPHDRRAADHHRGRDDPLQVARHRSTAMPPARPGVRLTAMTNPTTPTKDRWLGPGVAGIGTASFLADVGHEIPTALLPNLLTVTLGAPAAALGLIEGIADGLAGAARLAGGAIADDPQRRRVAVGGYTTTAVLSSLIGAATAVWQVGVLRAGAWAARGLRVPARNALLADIVPRRRVRPGLRLRAGHGQPGRHRRPPARPGPGRPGRGPHRHRPVGHPRAAGRPGHRLCHPPRPPRRGAGAATAAAAHPAGPDRAAGPAHGRGVGLRVRECAPPPC